MISIVMVGWKPTLQLFYQHNRFSSFFAAFAVPEYVGGGGYVQAFVIGHNQAVAAGRVGAGGVIEFFHRAVFV